MARLTVYATLVLLLAPAAGGAVGSEWLRITGPPELVFPADHGAHPDYRTEWWYATGLVADAEGRRFGFQITFFRQGLAPGAAEAGSSALRARQIMAAHMAIADVGRQHFLHAERLRRTGGGLAGYSEDDLRVWLDDWKMERRGDGVIAVRARDPAQDIELRLELKPEKNLVLHGEGGYSKKGADPGNASVYLSWTRLSVSGSLEIDGSPRPVSGSAWFDHEWGTSTLGEGVAGWDWISLRLDDDRDLMAFRLRRGDGRPDTHSSGTLIEADGAIRPLRHEDFEIKDLAWWTSPSTGARYPVRWRVAVPDAGIDLEVRSLVPESELDGSATTGVIYWEGPVQAQGTHNGEGYVEMTGYAGSLEGRF